MPVSSVAIRIMLRWICPTKTAANPTSVIQILDAATAPEGNLYYNSPEDFVFREQICPTKLVAIPIPF